MESLPQLRTIGDVIIKPGFVLETRSIPDYELVYFPSANRTEYIVEGVTYRMDQPSLIITKPGESHTYRFDPSAPVRHLFAHFDFSRLCPEDARYGVLLTQPTLLPVTQHSLIHGLFTQMLQLAHQPQAPSRNRRLSVLLLAVIEEWAALNENSVSIQPNRLPAAIAKAVAFMDRHLLEPLTIEQVAKETGWTHEHFSRKFAEVYGMTPRKALVERRIRRAEQLLLAETWTIKRIAFETGFADEHHFSKTFKQWRALNPTEFRNKYADPLLRNTATLEGLELPYPMNRIVQVEEIPT
ncbi:AraC family transcriptional regulator [Paenibacillus gansuensis]|uniref:Helix-turn-helix domain-containing protein n=1 Tax=Paenibacillus gansuensis TaxID=306542 RepID=A0ABW5PEQ2_9BACL